ncbi:MAG: restriction endonuclease subunit S [Bacteroidales bacterium]|nr:restriction endonuclease subunit S [Bacteroidales bacterium]
MDTKKLRQKILDLAIHGKLVAQNPNDEPASELLKRINPKAEIISNSEQYENLPNGWCLTPMQTLCSLNDGKKQIGIERINLDVKYLRGEYNGKILTEGKYTPCNSLLILVDGENSGEVFRTTIDGYQGSTFKQLSINNEVNTDYILHIINLHRKMLRENKVGSAIPHLNKKIFKEIEIPLPPLAEQKRIVEAIDKWFALIDSIENNKADLETTIKQTKSKILDLAIHGKLVAQNPNDEPASELLKRINPKAEIISNSEQYENLPFDIPKNWCWCKVLNIGEVITGNTPSKDKIEYYSGSIPFFKPADLEQGIDTKYASDHLSELGFEQSRKLPANTILVTCIGATIGKTGIITVAGSCNQQINAIIPHPDVIHNFIYYVCVSDYMQNEIKSNASATTLPILNKGNFSNLLFPLPPLAEQKRIVEAIDKAFKYLDAIAESL